MKQRKEIHGNYSICWTSKQYTIQSILLKCQRKCNDPKTHRLSQNLSAARPLFSTLFPDFNLIETLRVA